MRLKRASLFPLAIFLFFLFNLSLETTDRIREKSVATLLSVWKAGQRFNHYWASRPGVFWNRPTEEEAFELKKLRIENQRLRQELAYALQWIEGGALLGEEKSALFRAKLERSLWMIPARILYRDPSSWSSHCWIDVGKFDNEQLGQEVVFKNSPVVSGDILIGVIEYVGQKQSRVRLITDACLVPSVEIRHGDKVLARGELKGSSHALWRAKKPLLEGNGFHFEKERGYCGAQVGDLLWTSGLDGVFPEGLLVGKIVSLGEEKPGGYAFSLQAEALGFSDGSNLSSLFVLPLLSE